MIFCIIQAFRQQSVQWNNPHWDWLHEEFTKFVSLHLCFLIKLIYIISVIKYLHPLNRLGAVSLQQYGCDSWELLSMNLDHIAFLDGRWLNDNNLSGQLPDIFSNLTNLLEV